MVGINTTIKSAPDLPFGGVKAFEIGRELGRFGLDEFANKMLVRGLVVDEVLGRAVRASSGGPARTASRVSADADVVPGSFAP